MLKLLTAALAAAATAVAVGAFLLGSLDCCDHPEAG